MNGDQELGHKEGAPDWVPRGARARRRDSCALPKSPNFAVFACRPLGALAAALSASSKSVYSAAPKIRPGGRLYAPKAPANFLGCHHYAFFYMPENVPLLLWRRFTHTC